MTEWKAAVIILANGTRITVGTDGDNLRIRGSELLPLEVKLVSCGIPGSVHTALQRYARMIGDTSKAPNPTALHTIEEVIRKQIEDIRLIRED